MSLLLGLPEEVSQIYNSMDTQNISLQLIRRPKVLDLNSSLFFSTYLYAYTFSSRISPVNYGTGFNLIYLSLISLLPFPFLRLSFPLLFSPHS